MQMLTREIQIYVCNAGRITVGQNTTKVAFTKEKEGRWGILKIFYEDDEGSQCDAYIRVRFPFAIPVDRVPWSTAHVLPHIQLVSPSLHHIDAHRASSRSSLSQPTTRPSSYNSLSSSIVESARGTFHDVSPRSSQY